MSMVKTCGLALNSAHALVACSTQLWSSPGSEPGPSCCKTATSSSDLLHLGFPQSYDRDRNARGDDRGRLYLMLYYCRSTCWTRSCLQRLVRLVEHQVVSREVLTDLLNIVSGEALTDLLNIQLSPERYWQICWTSSCLQTGTDRDQNTRGDWRGRLSLTLYHCC